jgi:hypothetical protein
LQRNQRCSILFSEESSCDPGPKAAAAAAAAVILDSVFGRKQLRSWTESSSSSSDLGFCFRKKSSGDLGSKAAAILDSVFEEWNDP